MKDNYELIKRNVLVIVPHPKVEEIICTCVKDNFVGKR